MEQLIEKYKREMLNYSARSTVPVEVPDGMGDEGVPNSRYEGLEQSRPPAWEQPSDDGTHDSTDDAGRSTEHEHDGGQEYADTVQEETPESQAPEYEPSVPTLATTDSMRRGSSEKDIAKYEEMSKRSVTSLSDLQESCRRAAGVAAGEEQDSALCGELDSFLSANTAKGTMSVETYASDRVFGIVNARIMVFIPLESGNVLIFDGLTDIDGTSRRIELPAPSKQTSLSPNAKGLPYAGYTVLVEHPDYVRAVFFNVPVFEGIESIQPVQMLARASGTDEPNPIIVTNEEPPPIRGSAEE